MAAGEHRNACDSNARFARDRFAIRTRATAIAVLSVSHATPTTTPPRASQPPFSPATAAPPLPPRPPPPHGLLPLRGAARPRREDARTSPPPFPVQPGREQPQPALTPPAAHLRLLPPGPPKRARAAAAVRFLSPSHCNLSQKVTLAAQGGAAERQRHAGARDGAPGPITPPAGGNRRRGQLRSALSATAKSRSSLRG